MTEGTQTKKQNLDLALIGNSCAAAFVDQNARIVWWCYPHFDSDPVFSRLLAGDEEKGSAMSRLRTWSKLSPSTCATPRSSRRF